MTTPTTEYGNAYRRGYDQGRFDIESDKIFSKDFAKEFIPLSKHNEIVEGYKKTDGFRATMITENIELKRELKERDDKLQQFKEKYEKGCGKEEMILCRTDLKNHQGYVVSTCGDKCESRYNPKGACHKVVICQTCKAKLEVIEEMIGR